MDKNVTKRYFKDSKWPTIRKVTKSHKKWLKSDSKTSKLTSDSKFTKGNTIKSQKSHKISNL